MCVAEEAVRKWGGGGGRQEPEHTTARSTRGDFFVDDIFARKKWPVWYLN